MALLCSASVLTTELADLVDNSITAEAVYTRSGSDIGMKTSHNDATLGQYSHVNQYIPTVNGNAYRSIQLNFGGTTKYYDIAAFCLNHNALFDTAYSSSISTSPTIAGGVYNKAGNRVLTEDQAWELLDLICYFGYPYGQGDYQLHSSGKGYVPLGMTQSHHSTTQLLAWEITNGNRDANFNLVSNTGSSRSDAEIHKEIVSYTYHGANIYDDDLNGNGKIAYNKVVERIQRYLRARRVSNNSYSPSSGLTGNWNGKTYTLKLDKSNKDWTTGNNNNIYDYTMTWGLSQNVGFDIPQKIKADDPEMQYGSFGSYETGGHNTIIPHFSISEIRNKLNNVSVDNGVFTFKKTYTATSLNATTMQRLKEGSDGTVNTNPSSSATPVFNFYTTATGTSDGDVLNGGFHIPGGAITPKNNTSYSPKQWMWYGNTVSGISGAKLSLAAQFVEVDIQKIFKNSYGSRITSQTKSSTENKSLQDLINSGKFKFVVLDQDDSNKYVTFSNYANSGNNYKMYSGSSTSQVSSAVINLNDTIGVVDNNLITLKLLLPEGNYIIREINEDGNFATPGSQGIEIKVKNGKTSKTFTNTEYPVLGYSSLRKVFSDYQPSSSMTAANISALKTRLNNTSFRVKKIDGSNNYLSFTRKNSSTSNKDYSVYLYKSGSTDTKDYYVNGTTQSISGRVSTIKPSVYSTANTVAACFPTRDETAASINVGDLQLWNMTPGPYVLEEVVPASGIAALKDYYQTTTATGSVPSTSYSKNVFGEYVIKSTTFYVKPNTSSDTNYQKAVDGVIYEGQSTNVTNTKKDSTNYDNFNATLNKKWLDENGEDISNDSSLVTDNEIYSVYYIASVTMVIPGYSYTPQRYYIKDVNDTGGKNYGLYYIKSLSFADGYHSSYASGFYDPSAWTIDKDKAKHFYLGAYKPRSQSSSPYLNQINIYGFPRYTKNGDKIIYPDGYGGETVKWEEYRDTDNSDIYNKGLRFTPVGTDATTDSNHITEFPNQEKYVNVKITKTDNQSLPVQGAEFVVVYNPNRTSAGGSSYGGMNDSIVANDTIIVSGTTDENGMLTMKIPFIYKNDPNLYDLTTSDRNNFYIYESHAPSGYTKSEAVHHIDTLTHNLGSQTNDYQINTNNTTNSTGVITVYNDYEDSSFNNDRKTGKLKIVKTTDENQIGTSAAINNVKFKVYVADDNFDGAEETSLTYGSQTLNAGTLIKDGTRDYWTTDANGEINISNIPLTKRKNGDDIYFSTKLRIVEDYTSVVSPYVKENVTKYVTITTDQANLDPLSAYVEEEVNVVNHLQNVNLSITKADKNNTSLKLGGAKFRVTANNDLVVNGTTVVRAGDFFELTTSSEGATLGTASNHITTTDPSDPSSTIDIDFPMYVGVSYTVTEMIPPDGYELSNPTSQTFTVPYDATVGKSFVAKSVAFYNDPAGVNVSIIKRDSNNPDRLLNGAKFQLYAGEAVDVDGVSYAVNSPIGEEIETGAGSNATGKASLPFKLPKGKKFYLLETVAPSGYANIYNTTDHKLEFTTPTTGDYTQSSPFEVIAEEPEQTISITALKRYAKIDASGSVVNTTKPLAGAVFTLYATDTVTVGGVVYHAGDVIETSQATGTSGSVTFTKNVPVGHSYEVAETAITSNSPVVIRNTDRQTVYVAASTTSTEPVINQSLTFYNKQTMGVIEAVKVDENNNNIRLNGATFVLKAAEDIKLADGTIWTYNGQQITSGKTIATVTTKNDIEDINAATQTRADGIARFPEVPVGFKYTLEEQTAPVNYVRQNPIETFTFTAASSIDNNSNTVVYRSVFEEHWQKGKISVYKKAIQDGVQSNIPLGGAKFGLYVLSNTVYDPDNPTQVLYTRNLTTPIQIVETNSTDGYAEFDPVPVGYQYRIKEIEPPNNYVNSNFSNDFTLQYAAQFQDIEYITKSFDVYNPYQTAQINVYKKITGKDLPLAGAKFKLEAAETVYKPDGTTVLYNNNQQIGAIQQTGTNGKLTFSTQVPVGYKYRIVEVEAPAGYINNSGAKEFTPTGNKSVEYVTYDTDPIYNPETHISVSKKKATGNEELAGASLEIRYASNNTVVTHNGSRLAWVSGTTPYEITALPAGNYILHETASPNGYHVTSDIPFTLNANGSVTSSTSGAVTTVGGVPTVIMRDNYTRVSVKKVDAGTNNPLPNAKLRIKDKTTGNIVVAEWTTDTTGTKVIEGVLTVGKTYILEETAAPAGYKVAQSKEFTVEARTASQGPQEVVMADDYTTIKFAKADGATNGLLAGAEFEVRAQGSSTAYVYNGITMKWTSTTSAKEFYRLPAGNYVLVEIKAPNGYDLAPDIPFTVNQNGTATSSVSGAVSTSNGVSTITMSDSKNSFGVIKVDQDTNKPLSGAIFGLYDSDDNEIERWTSVAGEVKKFTGLTPGKYIIKELKAPRGYNTAAPYEFTIDNNTGDVTYTFKDNQGFRLPETGGSGTIILFSCAIVLILAGVVYFATRKKK